MARSKDARDAIAVIIQEAKRLGLIAVYLGIGAHNQRKFKLYRGEVCLGFVNVASTPKSPGDRIKRLKLLVQRAARGCKNA